MEEMNDLRDNPPEPGAAEAPRTVPENPELPAGGVGYLIVRVTTALGSIPLEGISVTVRNYNPEGESGKGAVITTLVTGAETPSASLLPLRRRSCRSIPATSGRLPRTALTSTPTATTSNTTPMSPSLTA